MEVALVSTVSIGLHTLSHTRFQCQAGVHDECAARLDKFGEMSETLEIILGCAIDVQMVGIGRGHHCDIGSQVMERAVKLVGLDDRVRARGRQQEIAVVVAQHTAEKGVAPHARTVQDVGRHTRCGGLAVGAGKAQGLAV